MPRFLSVVVGVLGWLCSAQGEETFDVFLTELTIFQSHEPHLFLEDTPEVYISCDDGLPHVDLPSVKRVRQRYMFELGGVLVTPLKSSGSTRCHLKEDDVLSDDDFGTWLMDPLGFNAAGSLTVYRPWQFLMVLECPDCINVEPSTEVSLPLPSEPTSVEVALPSVIAEERSDVGVEDFPFLSVQDDEYDYVLAMFEDSAALQTKFAAVRDEISRTAVDNTEPDQSDSGNSTSGLGVSNTIVLAFCFLFLVIGLAFFHGIAEKRNRDAEETALLA